MNYVLEHWKGIALVAALVVLFYVFLWGLLEAGSQADDAMEEERRRRGIR